MEGRTGRNRPNSAEMIFGTRAVLEAIEADKEFDKILLQKTSSDVLEQLIMKAKVRNIPIQRVPNEKLNRITRKNHQGVIAFISPVSFSSLDHLLDEAYRKGRDPFLIILDHITDIRNLGAIARSASCAGVDGIIIPERGQAPINADAVKASAGALLHIPVVRTANLVGTIRVLKHSGLTILGATEKAEVAYYNQDMTMPTALVMGAEDTGLSNEMLKHCDHLIRIPLTGKIDSLNVSVATGILLFDSIRQRSVNQR